MMNLRVVFALHLACYNFYSVYKTSAAHLLWKLA